MPAISGFDGVIGILVLVPLFVSIQRRVHVEAQVLLYLFTGRVDLTFALFSLLLLPGVFLHELSHYLMARLLRVPVLRFSLKPHLVDKGSIRLGFVETAQVDIFRDTLIGFAPLMLGSVIIASIGIFPLHLGDIANEGLLGAFGELFRRLMEIFRGEDFWLWFYLVLAISTTMFPSSADRKSGLWVLGFFLFTLVIIWLLGGGAFLFTFAGGTLNKGLQAFCVVLGLSTICHFVVLIPLLFVRLLLQKAGLGFC